MVGGLAWGGVIIGSSSTVQCRGRTVGRDLGGGISIGIGGRILDGSSSQGFGFLGGKRRQGFVQLDARWLFPVVGSGGPISLPASLHQRLVAFHTEDPLGRSSIAQVVDFLFAVPAAKTAFAKGLFAGQDGEVLDFIRTRAATVGAVAADERTIAE